MAKRLRRIAATYLAGALAVLVFAYVFHRREQARLAQRIAGTDELLERTCRVQETGTLGDELAALSADTGLPLVVEWDALAKENITPKTAVGIVCHDEPLTVVLRQLLLSAQDSATPGTFNGTLGATFRPSTTAGFYVDGHGRVVVTGYSQIPLTLVCYDLRDLWPVWMKDTRGAGTILHRLLVDRNDVQTMTDVRNYQRIGAWCCDRDMIQMDYSTQRLFVMTTPDGHRRIRKLLQRLRNEPDLLKHVFMPFRMYM
ncbi:MAG TPA: hypothetical protein VFE47_17010 [Tepidisphaeraceae bacterium]|jgi:hypothetical protein|nr:hypothetical protein [Tepidisphaeraceae bacterium]